MDTAQQSQSTLSIALLRETVVAGWREPHAQYMYVDFLLVVASPQPGPLPVPVQSDAVRRQLNSGCVVLLSNLGFSAAGEVLNCDIYTGEGAGMQAEQHCQAATLLCVPSPAAELHSRQYLWRRRQRQHRQQPAICLWLGALLSQPTRTPFCPFLTTVAARAAIDLKADKLIVMTTPDSQPLHLPLWLPLSDAEAMLRRMAPEGDHAGLLDSDLQRGGRGACALKKSLWGACARGQLASLQLQACMFYLTAPTPLPLHRPRYHRVRQRQRVQRRCWRQRRRRRSAGRQRHRHGL